MGIFQDLGPKNSVPFNEFLSFPQKKSRIAKEDFLGAHSDPVETIGPWAIIASVTFGAARHFRMKPVAPISYTGEGGDEGEVLNLYGGLVLGIGTLEKMGKHRYMYGKWFVIVY